MSISYTHTHIPTSEPDGVWSSEHGSECWCSSPLMPRIIHVRRLWVFAVGSFSSNSPFYCGSNAENLAEHDIVTNDSIRWNHSITHDNKSSHILYINHPPSSECNIFSIMGSFLTNECLVLSDCYITAAFKCSVDAKWKQRTGSVLPVMIESDCSNNLSCLICFF